MLQGKRGSLMAALALVLIAFTAFSPVWKAGFIWDDDAHITANPCIIGPLGLKEIWTSEHARICPLVLTTFWMEHRLWGLNPLPYHLVNVLMHAAAALVLWRVLLRLKIPGAWLGAALWMLHPVQVESVAWITEMKNTQSGLFFLLAILYFCKSRQAESAEGQESRSRFYYVLTLVFGLLALASKSSAVVLPVVLGLCAWWLDGHWRWRRNLIQLSPLLVMSVLASVLSIWTQKLEGAGGDVSWALSGMERLVVAGRAPWFYLGKLLWPHPLVMIYPRWEITTSSMGAWLPLIAALLVSVVLWRHRNGWNGRGRALFFAWSYFVVALLPVLGLLNHGFLQYSFVGDHFQYLASMGPLALAGAGLGLRLESPGRIHPCLKPGLCALFLVIPAALTWRQCAIYENGVVLWQATLVRNPACWVARNNLGILFQREGRMEEAIVQYQKALEIKPDNEVARNNLGCTFHATGRLEEAIVEFQKVIEIKPDYAEAYNNYGNIFLQKGQMEEAMAQFQKALQINPRLALSYFNIGTTHLRKGRLEEALAQFRKVIELEPDYAEAYNGLGNAYLGKGLVDEAMAQYHNALRIKPDYADAHYNLGNAFLGRGRLDEAMVRYQRAIELKPDHAEALNNLGNAYLQKGQLDEALARFRKAIELKPDLAQAYYHLGSAYLQSGRTDDAMTQFQKAIELKPDYAEALNNLGNVYLGKGRLDEAMEQYQTALAARPDYADAHYNLGSALMEKGRPGEAIAKFQKVLQINPDYLGALSNLALLLATSEDASLRDGARAVALARQADRLSGAGNPVVLGALAGAYAEAGNFAEAVETAQRAVQAAQTQGHATLVNTLQGHLKLYRDGQPLRIHR